MDFDKYQWEAEQTCLSPAYRLEYLMTGMAGEVGEVTSLYAKYIRDETPYNKLRDDMSKELGDVLWFVAVTCAFLDLDMAKVAEQNVKKLQDRQARGTLKGSGNDR